MVRPGCCRDHDNRRFGADRAEMMLNRRGFFSTLAAVAATAALDPERLLWLPGKKLISIPAAITVSGEWTPPMRFEVGDVITIGKHPQTYIVTDTGPSLTDVRFRHGPRPDSVGITWRGTMKRLSVRLAPGQSLRCF